MSWIRAARCRARTRIGLLGVLVLLCGSALACAAVAGETQPVRIALTREPSAAAFYIALAKGYFKAEGLDPRVTFLKNDAAVSAAVASGKADIGMAGLSAPFYAAAAAHGLKMIASRSSDQAGFPMDVLLVSKKARAAGLSGVRGLPHARIGIAGADALASYALFSIATRFRLDPGSIATIALKSPAGELAALARGDIDAALLPYATALHAVGKGQSLLRLSDFAQWQQGVVFTAAETIAKRRGLVERFMRAYQHGTTEYQLNFLEYDDAGDFIPGPDYDRYLHLIARRVQMSPDLLALTKPYCDRRANLDVADIENQTRFWQDRGRLDKRIAAADLLDLSFIGEEAIGAPPERR
jgi:NitT/TauT family transport system substrate-binding protein